MKRVLIVDDDYLVRKYLSQLIEWETAGFELMEPARDGKQALEAIKKYRPDIVLTDIDMPVMNGIDLLLKVRKEPFRPHMIVLSCHDDFMYVRESMRLGAEEYFLKDEISGEKLLEILRGVAAAEDKETRSCSNKRAEITVSDEELLRLLEGTGSDSEISIPDAIAALYVTDLEDASGYQQVDKRVQFYSSFSKMCEEESDNCRDIKVIHVRGGWFAAFLSIPAGKTTQERRYILQKNMSIFQHKADRHYEVTLRIGVSEMAECKNDVHICWESAKDITGRAFYSRRSIFFGWQTECMGKSMPQKARDFLDIAAEMRARRDHNAVKIACNNALEAFEQEHTKESVVISWLHSADKLFGLGMLPAPAHFEDMHERVKAYVAACDERLPDTDTYGENVSGVIRFIQKNYSRDISLYDAALEVHLSTTYLSYIFHKETGITFSEYLQSCRIGRARDLLEHTDEKVREIGHMVGYNDNRHFGKIFKKMTGMTPQEYRRKNRS